VNFICKIEQTIKGIPILIPSEKLINKISKRSFWKKDAVLSCNILCLFNSPVLYLNFIF